MSNQVGKNISKIINTDTSEVSEIIKEKARIISNCTKIPFNQVIKILCSEKQKSDLSNLNQNLLDLAS